MNPTPNRPEHTGLAAILLAAIFCNISFTLAEDAPTPFSGEKTAWHGFDRYDFLMDEESLTLKPFTAAPDEKNGIKGQIKGQRRCVVVVPKEAAPGKPWSWQGCYWDHEPQAEIELLKRGFHIAYIMVDANTKPDKHWDAWYAFLTERHGLSNKPAFIGMSRGGEYSYIWATANPDKVSCIYADNTGGNRDILTKLGELARYDVPILHVCGSIDPILGKYSLPIENIYQQFGGRISTMIKEGFAHHPHSLRDPKPIADFIVQSFQEAGIKGQSAAPLHPDFTGEKFIKIPYYSNESFYRDFTDKEGTYITCRGPLFTECHERCEFDLGGVKGTIRVLVPKTVAPGKPWVYRADFVGRDALVDFALLAKGYHIVTGPVPYDVNSLSLQHWNAVYKHLTDHGFSKKPVMAGAGGAAGEAYAWAIENPENVSCIYAENPVLRGSMSKAPALDNLAPLAKAGVPILHVCGSLDPRLNDHTRVLEKRYKELGGQITVIVKEGEGHFPSAPRDISMVVKFIVDNTK
jgi:pimeloyl-ACP methyl ester carboxylesterase